MDRKLKQFINIINARAKIVFLVESGEYSLSTFQIRFKFINTPYIDDKIYFSGHAIIYLSDKFYKDIDEVGKMIFGQIPHWNNHKTIGWFTLKKKVN